MRALVIREPHKIEYCEVEARTDLGPQDVLVRSVAVGICGTDLEILEGLISSDFVTYPVVPGHEWSGTVEKVGSEVNHLQPGDRVISEGIVACGRCENCRQGKTNLCMNYDQIGFTRNGGCAEWVVAPAKGIHKIPDNLSFEAAVLVEPGASVLRGIMETPIEPGMSVVVVGPGTLGLIAIKLFKAFGAGKIILIGRNDEKLEVGRSIGATHVINSSKEDVAELVNQWTDGKGAHIVMETAGSTQAVSTSFELCRKGGHVVLEGVAGADAQLQISADIFILNDLTIHGIFSYTTTSWAKMLQMIDQCDIDLEPLIAYRYSMANFQEAFDTLRSKKRKGGKVILTHGGHSDV